MRAPSRAAISTASGFSPPTPGSASSLPSDAHVRGTTFETTGRVRRSRCSATSARSRRGRARGSGCERQVVDDALRQVGTDVHVQVVRAADESRALSLGASCLPAYSKIRRISRLAVATRGSTPSSTQQLAGRVHLLDAPHRMRAAPLDEALEERRGRSRRRSRRRASRARRAPPPRPRSRGAAAATPFMNTERTSLSAAASPGRSETTCDRHPERGEHRPRTPGRGPDASAGVARPRAGTGPRSATSAKRAPTIAASSRLSAGPAVFTSAYTASARSAGSALDSAAAAAAADVNESTTSRSNTASRASATPFATAGSKPRTSTPAASRSRREPPACLTQPEHRERRQ